MMRDAFPSNQHNQSKQSGHAFSNVVRTMRYSTYRYLCLQIKRRESREREANESVSDVDWWG